jgi:hypothetical protein
MRVAVGALAVLCVVTMGLSTSHRALAQGPDGTEKASAASATNSPKIMWTDPTDLESRDLIHGIGGREGAPDPAARYTFVADHGSPEDSNPKIDVTDDQGRRWTVKFGPEVRAETAATRLVWAVGYHVDEDYFVERATIEGYDRNEAVNMRFERDDDPWKKVSRWNWKANPFVGTRELDGLRTLMALIHNVDLAEYNNKVVRRKKQPAGTPEVYYVNDLGAALGSTGSWFTKLPLLTKAPSESKGVPADFVKNDFIKDVKNGQVNFRITRKLADDILDGVKVEHARWMGDLLARLSDKQLRDAFRSGGFNDEEVTMYVTEIRERIKQLQSLK